MCKLTHFKNRQIANTLQSISVSVLVSATHLQEDLSQLVVVWLYSNINARLPSTDAIFGINCHHAATKSLLIEPFLSLFQRFWWISVYEDGNKLAILTNLSKLMSVITNRQHVITNLFPFHHKLIADWLGLIAILLPSWHTKVALKGAADWSQCSKQPFQRKQDHNIVLHCHSNFGHAAIFSHFYPSVTLSLADDRKNAETLLLILSSEGKRDDKLDGRWSLTHRTVQWTKNEFEKTSVSVDLLSFSP